MTISDDQLSGWMVKKLQSTSQNQTCTQKMSWSLFDGLLLIWSTIAFWIRVKPLSLRSMLSKLMRCTENGNTCSQHWSTEKAQFFSTTMPNHTLHNQHGLGYKFCLVHHIHLTSHQPTTTSKHLDNFLQRKCFHNQQEAENAFQEFLKPWSTDFYAIEINKLISHWQKCVDCNASYFE